MNIRIASLLGIVASATAAVGLFLVFRISIEFLGAATVGSWVMIQGAFFLSRVAEGGVGINLTRIYAVDRGAAANASPVPYYMAGLLLVLVPVSVVGAFLILPVEMLLLYYFDTQVSPSVIRRLVLLSYLIAVLNAFGSVGMATVEGRGKLSWRHAGTICSNAVFVLGAYPLIHHFGVIGLALLYVLAASVVVVVSCAILWRMCRMSVTIQPVSTVVKRVWQDSLSATTMVLVRTAFEPWTKFLVGVVGGLAAVAALDLAFRVTTQVRVLIQSATQPLLLVGARSNVLMSDQSLDTYAKASSMIVQANWGALALLLSIAPIVSLLGFGYISTEMVSFLIILAIGNSINSVGVVGYYAEASGGSLSRLLRIHLVMMVMNISLGIWGGAVFGTMGVVVAVAVSLAYGGIALLRIWARVSSTRMTDLIWPDRWIVIVAAFALTAAVGATFLRVEQFHMVVFSLGLTALTAILLAPFYFARWRNFVLR